MPQGILGSRLAEAKLLQLDPLSGLRGAANGHFKE
jgi:hypothetical protein